VRAGGDAEGFSSDHVDRVEGPVTALPADEPDLRRGPGGGRADRGAGREARRALDSTVLDDAVATQDTMTR
jgi:hypothetical protein